MSHDQLQKNNLIDLFNHWEEFDDGKDKYEKTSLANTDIGLATASFTKQLNPDKFFEKESGSISFEAVKQLIIKFGAIIESEISKDTLRQFFDILKEHFEDKADFIFNEEDIDSFYENHKKAGGTTIKKELASGLLLSMVTFVLINIGRYHPKYDLFADIVAFSSGSLGILQLLTAQIRINARHKIKKILAKPLIEIKKIS
jgi:hypothetical protein